MSTPPNREKPKFIKGLLLPGLLACSIVLVSLLLAFYELRVHLDHGTRGRRMEITPARFKVVVFPRRGDQNNPVERAVLLSLEEFTSETVQVSVEGKRVQLRSADFQALPDEATEKDDVEALNREIAAAAGGTEWKRIEYTLKRGGNDGKTAAKIMLTHQRGSRFEYLYEITSEGKIIPVWALSFGPI